MLKSPTEIEYEFPLLNVCSDGVISSMKHDMFWLLLLSLGGLYIFLLGGTCIATDNACKLVINLIFNTIIYRIYIQYGYL